MDDNKNNTDYQPNFIMTDPDEKKEKTLYRDPRTNFQNIQKEESSSKVHFDTYSQTPPSSRCSASWSDGSPRSSNGFGRETSRKAVTKEPVFSKTLTKKTLAILIVCCLVLSAAAGFGGAYLGFSLWSNDHVSSAPQKESKVSSSSYKLEDATGSKLTVQEITQRAQPSVVEIKTEAVAVDSWMQEYVTEGAGSGVIISKDGYIVTNNHVISGADKIYVTTSDDETYDAKLVGTDSNSDIAVLKIKASGLTPAVYGNSDQLRVGDLAVAIGNPLGELGGTVTAGIISATDRELSIEGKTMTLLQTDSSINPGNSGGGLFNGDGQLIGIVVAKSSGSDVEGLGFAIPVNKAAKIATEIMDKGYVSGQPWTGMTYTEGSSGFDSMFGGSSGTVYIYSVDTNKAKLAGFKAGDIVFAVDGVQITSIEDLTAIVTSHKVGDKLKYTIVRDGYTKDLKLELQEKTKKQSQ